MKPVITIQLPANFSPYQEQIILKYLTRGRHSLSYSEWGAALSGFNELHQAIVITQTVNATFRQVYNKYVDLPFADLYLSQLLNLPHIGRQFSALHAQVKRSIVAHLGQVGLRRVGLPDTNLLLAYCLYFFHSFATGYAFEVQIYRDLTASGIVFDAHDILDRKSRFQPYDLSVLGLYGDIKTSLYFLRVGRSQKLPHDFYITRLYAKGRARTLVVMLKLDAWKQIDGDTVARLLEEAVQAFPNPVSVKLDAGTVVITDYEVWKSKILSRQYSQEGEL